MSELLSCGPIADVVAICGVFVSKADEVDSDDKAEAGSNDGGGGQGAPGDFLHLSPRNARVVWNTPGGKTKLAIGRGND